jgi:hypothetical protein
MTKSIRRAKRGARAAATARCTYPIDATWKQRVRDLMEEQGISQAELARRIKASPPAIVLLFKPATLGSTLVPAIHRELGLRAPEPTRAIAA